ncbi:MAG: RluA family pseudouridine synthase [Bdellovibrionota bacterium]
MAPFQILFEDDDLVAAVKPAGVVVHSTRESGDDVLSLASRQVGRELFAFHRLDKGTSGILLLGKRSGPVAAGVTQAFEKKLLRKAYLAVVSGAWDSKVNRIEAALEKTDDGVVVSESGKASLTTFRVLAKNSEKSLIEALPKTGRTHQIRVHCAHVGHPVLGDLRYGSPSSLEPENAPKTPDALALHAHSLSFTHPRTKEKLELRSLPEGWRDTWLSGLDVEAVWARLAK